MGLFRMGFVTRLLLHPVLSGFTSASPLTILLGQLKHILGFSPVSINNLFELLADICVRSPNEAHWTSLVMGVDVLFFLQTFKSIKLLRRLPAAFLVLALGIPVASLPVLPSSEHLAPLMTLVLVASLIGYMESMTVSMVCANKTAMNLNQTKNWSRRALPISWALSFTLFLRRGAWANVRQHSSWVQDTAGGNPLGSHHARCSRCPHTPLLSPPALGAGVYCALCRVWAP